jgi:hypothetical protein
MTAAEAHLEVLGNLTDETLEGELADEELGGPGRVSVVHKVAEGTYFWYRLISLRATVPGLYLWGFFTPPVAALLVFLAALVETTGRQLPVCDG